ncbi:MAG: MAPEG family protein [Alkalinema sp. RU_4_3]|nr:MAPEG family protein [Alkalinema sp. RU_4_3]
MFPLVSLVTVLALILFVVVTINVGRARVKYGVKPPAMSGPPEFERAIRVQQNTLEQLIVFLPALWLFAHFVRPDVAAVIGGIWVIGRGLYAWGYYQAAEKRLLGFAIGFSSGMILLLGSLVGIVLQLVRSV